MDFWCFENLHSPYIKTAGVPEGESVHVAGVDMSLYCPTSLPSPYISGLPEAGRRASRPATSLPPSLARSIYHPLSSTSLVPKSVQAPTMGLSSETTFCLSYSPPPPPPFVQLLIQNVGVS
ncbi:unnamed protein product [Taenia asiatica]|uniref:Uncharacterized protein n=1 Tax=Taenia asiatica TaxID=60517 RepID=A0A0R3W4J9_TAEAS|nr:unnamed protein product [Taenia asiatica]